VCVCVCVCVWRCVWITLIYIRHTGLSVYLKNYEVQVRKPRSQIEVVDKRGIMLLKWSIRPRLSVSSDATLFYLHRPISLIFKTSIYPLPCTGK